MHCLAQAKLAIEKASPLRVHACLQCLFHQRLRARMQTVKLFRFFFVEFNIATVFTVVALDFLSMQSFQILGLTCTSENFAEDFSCSLSYSPTTFGTSFYFVHGPFHRMPIRIQLIICLSYICYVHVCMHALGSGLLKSFDKLFQ